MSLAEVGARAARSAAAALGPDNAGAPGGMSASARARGGSLEIEVRASGAAAASLAPTVDEMLAHAQAALEATGGC